MLASPPESPQGQPAPTPAEVRRLFDFAEAAIRRAFASTPELEAYAAAVRVLGLHLTRPDPDGARAKALETIVGRMSLALGLRGTPQGDALADAIGERGRNARAGARLAARAEELLLEAPTLDRAAHALALHLREPGVINFPADELRHERFTSVVRRTLRLAAVDVRGEFLDELRESAARRAAVARDVVVALAEASGFKGARERLFDAERKRAGRGGPDAPESPEEDPIG